MLGSPRCAKPDAAAHLLVSALYWPLPTWFTAHTRNWYVRAGVRPRTVTLVISGLTSDRCTFQGESGEWRQHSVFPDSFPGHRLMVVCTHGRDAQEKIEGSDSSRRSILNELHLSCPHQGIRVLGGGKLQLDALCPRLCPPQKHKQDSPRAL